MQNRRRSRGWCWHHDHHPDFGAQPAMRKRRSVGVEGRLSAPGAVCACVVRTFQSGVERELSNFNALGLVNEGASWENAG